MYAGGNARTSGRPGDTMTGVMTGGIIARVAVGQLLSEAVGAMESLRRKGRGPIEGDQQLIPQHTEGVSHMLLLKALDDRYKHRIEVARHERIAHSADLMVTGPLHHAKQGPGVIVPCGELQPALGLQKRRQWGEKDAKGAHGGILDGRAGVGTVCAMVRQWRGLSVQNVLADLEASRRLHDDLLRFLEIITVTMLVFIGNPKPFRRPK